MRWLQSILREIIGLFVDDGAFALTILLWLILIAVILPRVAAVAPWTGPLLFAGLAVILIASTIRFARRNRK